MSYNENMNIRISKLAKDLGVTKTTIWNWKREGRLEFIKDKTNGFNYVSPETYNKLLNINTEKKNSDKIVFIYSRVSSNDRKKGLDTQIERLVNYANINGYKVSKSFKEVGSGFNDNRKQLSKILLDLDFDILMVEHKDRLTRVGFNYIEGLLSKLGKEIIVVNEVDTDEKDIVQDFISIITSYTSRIYGNRRKNRKSLDFVDELKEI